MDDIIALVCPSCGGKIQVEKDLEKMFCMHCGTQLLLRQGADGLLTPMMARDLNASAQLKETQNKLMVIEALKTQIKEMEAQAEATHQKFIEYVDQEIRNSAYFKTKTIKLLDQYAQQVTGKKIYPSGVVYIDYKRSRLSTREDLVTLYQFITQPQRYDQTAYDLAQVLFPLIQVLPELQEKKQKLKKAMNEIA